MPPSRADLAARAEGVKPPRSPPIAGHFDQLGNVALAGHLRSGLQGLGLLEFPDHESETP